MISPPLPDVPREKAPENIRSKSPVTQVLPPSKPAAIVPVAPAPVRSPIHAQPPEKISKEVTPESKKDFEYPGDSKKDFDIPGHSKPEIEYDRDGDVGRWRTDDQVKELVIYRYEWKEWPEDVPVDTGLQSYYELRYFKNGMNRKGENYADLYGKHRAKRDLWIDEYTAEQATDHAQVDAPTSQSNVVPLRRSGTSN